MPSRRRSASPPTVTISPGRSHELQSRQKAQSSCSRGVGVRSPRPLLAPGSSA